MSKYARDLAERVTVTFATAFLGSITAPELLDRSLDAEHGAAIAGTAAVLELVRGILARYRGNPENASLLSE